MIVCPFKDLKRYTASIPGLEEAVAVMAGITDLTPRTIPLSGDNRIMIQSYTTKLPAEGCPEAHREFLDIQYVVDDAIVPTDRPGATFDLGEGVKKVQVVFPWSMKIGVEHMALEDCSFVTPVKRDKRYLIYGDSITHGSCSLYPSRSYAALMTQWLNAEAMNKAVGCEIYFPPLAEAATWENPDYITVAYGVNDWVQSTQEEFRENCRNFWKAVCHKYPNAKKFAMTPIFFPSTPEKCFGAFEEIGKIIREVMVDFPEVTLIDCTDFVSRDPMHYGDGWIHPGHTGFLQYFESLKKAIDPHV